MILLSVIFVKILLQNLTKCMNWHQRNKNKYEELSLSKKMPFYSFHNVNDVHDESR